MASECNEVTVKCGPATGSLHLDKLTAGSVSKEGAVECILSHDK